MITFLHVRIVEILKEKMNHWDQSCNIGLWKTIATEAQKGMTGKPFNIASYALLTMMVAQVCDLKPGEFIHTPGDTHLYSNHMEQVKEQLTRKPGASPTMLINPEIKDLFQFRFDDFTLVDYTAAPTIKAPIAV